MGSEPENPPLHSDSCRTDMQTAETKERTSSQRLNMQHSADLPGSYVESHSEAHGIIPEHLMKC